MISNLLLLQADTRRSGVCVSSPSRIGKASGESSGVACVTLPISTLLDWILRYVSWSSRRQETKAGKYPPRSCFTARCSLNRPKGNETYLEPLFRGLTWAWPGGLPGGPDDPITYEQWCCRGRLTRSGPASFSRDNSCNPLAALRLLLAAPTGCFGRPLLSLTFRVPFCYHACVHHDVSRLHVCAAV